MKIEKLCCDRCGKEVYPRRLFNLKGRPFETVISQRVQVPTSYILPEPRCESFDLCYECTIELRKFLGKNERTCVPATNYRPCNDEVFYLCDRKACNKCSDACRYTSDIRHAVNFYQPYANSDDASVYTIDKHAYFEIEVEIEMVDGKEKENDA